MPKKAEKVEKVEKVEKKSLEKFSPEWQEAKKKARAELDAKLSN